MKTCPTCKITTHDDDRCPICKTSLIYEPLTHNDREQLVFNKYVVVYFLKALWFPVACLLISVVCVIMWHEELGQICAPDILLGVLSVVMGMTQYRQPAWQARVYTKGYQNFISIFVKYLSGSLAVVLSTLPLWLSSH